MLDPHDRSLYLEALRPPEGYRLYRAVGTTYSVDLLSLLAVPLSFARLDWADDREGLLADPVSLLRSLREQAGRITLFCQAGRISAPVRSHPLFAHLEAMLVEAAAPHREGEFHAKTWLLRFIGPEEDPVRYRFLCLSRNLTADRSWDTVLCLEGDLTDRQNAIARNHPLGDFIEALTGLAKAPLDEATRKDVEKLAKEARRVRFEPPEPFEEVGFFPLGIDGHRGLDLQAEGASRLLVVSPFVTKGLLEEVTIAKENTLVSRQESLDELEPAVLKRFDKVYVLDDGADLDAQVADDDDAEADVRPEHEGADPRGLHAKLFLLERGWDVELLTGSANATSAAFERNVEFVVQLTGKKSRAGVGALLGDGDAREFLFGSLLTPYTPSAERPAADDEGRRNEEAVERARKAFSRARLSLRAAPSAVEGLYDVALLLESALSFPAGVRARCWLASGAPGEGWNAEALRAESRIRFEKLSVAQLTAFLCVEAQAGAGESMRAARFTLLLPLTGAPEDRMEQVLASVLGEPGQFLRFLLFLLRDPEADPAAAAELFAVADPGGSGASRAGAVPLLEDLLRVAARTPERLREVHRLVEDLKKSPAGAKVLPPGFEAVWVPIWEASGVAP